MTGANPNEYQCKSECSASKRGIFRPSERSTKNMILCLHFPMISYKKKKTIYHGSSIYSHYNFRLQQKIEKTWHNLPQSLCYGYCFGLLLFTFLTHWLFSILTFIMEVKGVRCPQAMALKSHNLQTLPQTHSIAYYYWTRWCTDFVFGNALKISLQLQMSVEVGNIKFPTHTKYIWTMCFSHVG